MVGRAKCSQAEEHLMGGSCDGSCHMWQLGLICRACNKLYSFYFFRLSFFGSGLGPRSSTYCLLMFSADSWAYQVGKAERRSLIYTG